MDKELQFLIYNTPEENATIEISSIVQKEENRDKKLYILRGEDNE